VRPPPGGVRQRESDGGQVLIGGVPVDAVAPCVGLDADGGARGDPGPGRLTAGLPAHPAPAWLHAGRVRAAWRSRSRLRRQAPATWRPVGGPNCRIADVVVLHGYALPCIYGRHDSQGTTIIRTEATQVADLAGTRQAMATPTVSQVGHVTV